MGIMKTGLESIVKKVMRSVNDKPVLYSIAGFAALGTATLIGVTCEDVQQGLKIIDSLGESYHYVTPLVIGISGGIAGWMIGKSNKKLAELSVTDGLTGLFNHRHFYKKLDEEIRRAERSRYPLSLLILDVDYFKQYNDAHGHLEGDKVLTGVGRILGENSRTGIDVAARYGGEEFAVLLPETNLESAMHQGERIRCAIKEAAGVNVSMGTTEYLRGESADSFVRRADKNLYCAKGNGRDQQCYLGNEVFPALSAVSNEQ